MSRTVVVMTNGTDQDLWLDIEGAREVRNVAGQMIQTGFQPDLVLSGPLRKMAETAAVIAEAYEQAGKQVAVRRDFRLRRGTIADALTKLNDERNVVVVADRDQIQDAVYRMTNTWLRGGEPQYAQAIFLSSEMPDWPSAAQSHQNKIVRKLKPFEGPN